MVGFRVIPLFVQIDECCRLLPVIGFLCNWLLTPLSSCGLIHTSLTVCRDVLIKVWFIFLFTTKKRNRQCGCLSLECGSFLASVSARSGFHLGFYFFGIQFSVNFNR